MLLPDGKYFSVLPFLRLLAICGSGCVSSRAWGGKGGAHGDLDPQMALGALEKSREMTTHCEEALTSLSEALRMS